MNQPNIEEIVRATIEQLTKQKPADNSDYEMFVAREERKKMKRFNKRLNK
jgi:hypothetical protein